jgi:sugar phosphate isomerase/epimerase
VTGGRELRIGVVLEAFLDWPLEEILPWLRRHAPEVTHVEVGAGGYAPHPHCDVTALLGSAQARTAWRDGVARHEMAISALNAWGNPLHPDAELARRHDQDLRNAIRLAAELGVGRVVALAGCPGGSAGDRAPHFGAGGWLPYLEGVYERQWEQIGPYWASLARALAPSRAEVVSIEHEDPFVRAETGVSEAARLLAAAIEAAQQTAAGAAPEMTAGAAPETAP